MKNKLFTISYTIVLFIFCFFRASFLYADENCDYLTNINNQAKSIAIQQKMKIQKETIFQPPNSLRDLSCMDILKKGINVALYSPISLTQMLNSLLTSVLDSVCDMAFSHLNSQLNKVEGIINGGGQLPYGLGTLYSVDLSSYGVEVKGPNMGSITGSAKGKTMNFIKKNGNIKAPF
jgi:hypothetical protein